jgi:hypothetical protein
MFGNSALTAATASAALSSTGYLSPALVADDFTLMDAKARSSPLESDRQFLDLLSDNLWQCSRTCQAGLGQGPFFQFNMRKRRQFIDKMRSD